MDPSPVFIAACRTRCPGADVRRGRAEELPQAPDRQAAIHAALLDRVGHPDSAFTFDAVARVVVGTTPA